MHSTLRFRTMSPQRRWEMWQFEGVHRFEKGGSMTQTSATQRSSEQADAIRPFNVNFPEAELTELRRRINATKWPERETVTDASQGVQLATSQALARYWG